MRTLLSIFFFGIFALAAAQDGTLLIKSNADCNLTIDGEASGELEAEEVKKFPLGPGEHLIRAVYKKQKQEKIIKIAPGMQSVLLLKFDTTPDYTSPNAADLTAHSIDPESIYSGPNGLRGRGIYSLPYPEFPTDTEGILEFRFKIEPDGSVSYASTTGPTSKTSLKAAGIAAIKKWKFAPVEDVPAQWATVKITFRIKK